MAVTQRKAAPLLLLLLHACTLFHPSAAAPQLRGSKSPPPPPKGKVVPDVLPQGSATKTSYTGRLTAIIESNATYFLNIGSTGAIIRLPKQPLDSNGTAVPIGSHITVTCDSVMVAGTCPVIVGPAVRPSLVEVASTQEKTTDLSMRITVALVRGCGYQDVDTNQVRALMEDLKAQMGRCSYGEVTVTYEMKYFNTGSCGALQDWCNQYDTFPQEIARAMSYDFLMVVFPQTPSCVSRQWGFAWAGLGQIGGRVTWYPPYGLSRHVVMQELIHNLGVTHSSRDSTTDQLCQCERMCNDGDGGLCAPCDGCHSEYGDASSCMGGGDVCPSAAELYRLKWGSSVAELDGNSLPVGQIKSFTVPPVQRDRKNVVVVRPTWTSPYNTNLYFSTRQRVGGDSNMPAEFVGTLSVHVSDSVVDSKPTNENAHEHVLGAYRPGTTKDFGEFRIRVSVGNPDGNGNLPFTLCRYNSNPNTECTTRDDTSCPAVAGYTAYTNSDHPGDDMNNGQYSTVQDLATVAAACNADCRCKSFNSWGWIKSSADVTSRSAAGMCFYTRNNPGNCDNGCPAVSGYTVYRGSDHPGDDLNNGQGAPVKDVAALATACNNDCRCKSFNNYGWLKQAADVTEKVSGWPGMCLYTRNNPVNCDTGCLSVAGYTAYSNADHPGDDMNNGQYSTVQDLAAVARACNTDCGCKSFNSWGWIKSSADVTSKTAAGMCFYTRDAPGSCDDTGCPSLAGYTVYRGSDHPGDDMNDPGPMAVVKDVASLAAACSNNCLCKSFNTYGYLKMKADVTEQKSSWPGMCLYTRNNPANCDTGCPAVAGYTVYAGADHKDDDLNDPGPMALVKDVAGLADRCNGDCRCKSFNTYGYLKTATDITDSPSAWPGMCLYTRDEPDSCDEGCIDSAKPEDRPNCPYWRSQGYCQESSEYYPYMNDNCEATCGLC